MGKFYATKLVFDNYIRDYVCGDYAPIEFETFENAKTFVDNEYDKYSISYNEEVIYNNINFIFKINGIRVSEEKFKNELFKASGKDFIEMEDLENRLLALGYIQVNGIDFEVEEIEEKLEKEFE